MVVRGQQPVTGARVWAEPLLPRAGSFATQSSSTGSFALALRLPPLAPDEAEAPVVMLLHLRDGPDERVLNRSIGSRREHRFAAPIDLAGDNDPDFLCPYEI
jgi:hypothetical protein